MAIPLTINGATFEYPQNFDENWGVDATGWAQAVTNGMLQMSGGSFPLTADVNFGPNFGLLSKYFETRSAFPASTGTVRLSSADAGVAWRNNAHGGDLVLTTNSSDQLLFNGHPIASSGGGAVTSITGTANQIIASASTGDITLSTPQNIATGSSPTFAGLTLSAPLSVPNGGTGATSFVAYAVLTGGTTSTGPVQSIASVGLAGQVLTSNGAGALPTYQNTTGTGTVNSGTASQVGYYATSSSAISGNPGLLITGTTIPILNVNGSGGAIALLTTTSHQAGMELDNGTGVFVLRDLTAPRNFLSYDPAGPTVAFATAVNMNSHKVTSVTQGTTTGDAISFPVTTTEVSSNTLTGSTANSGGSAGNIAQGTISTPDLRANAVTLSATSVTGTIGLSGTQVTTVSITTIGQPVLVNYSCTVNGTVATGALAVDTWVEIDGTEVTGSGANPLAQAGSGALRMPVSKCFVHTPSAGAHTYSLRFTTVTGTGVTVGQYSLNAIELRA